ncbi:GntR family transcriptional regulator [Actinocorallia herbida]|uniref:GntR family transcriptional regulator n=1 Tax=Actinocorallia herbida TaxID=58109 RepID=A0A3N1CV49_9ACTN|nr:GntR family transcriptional regulator [Actinocorallia herbida]ROO85171.1 GntR family transcriptional regulator [Actinocorallia herbida]
MRPPLLAELVADRLRERILSGELREGDVLPPQEQLMTELGVSFGVLREALRLLERDGLVEVRRGNVGGAVVRSPTVDRTAQAIGMLLQSRQTTAADVSTTLTRLEPICAGMCAARADRAETVVPALRALLDRQIAEIDDLDAYVPNARLFHEALVRLCGSDTMIVVVGALETLWSAHESSVWHSVTASARPTPTDPESHTDPMSRTVRRAAIRAHEKLLTAITAGDEPRAHALAAAHLSAARHNTLTWARTTTIRAAAIPHP